MNTSSPSPQDGDLQQGKDLPKGEASSKGKDLPPKGKDLSEGESLGQGVSSSAGISGDKGVEGGSSSGKSSSRRRIPSQKTEEEKREAKREEKQPSSTPRHYISVEEEPPAADIEWEKTDIKDFTQGQSAEVTKEEQKMYEGMLCAVEEKSIVKGRVSQLASKHAIVDIHYKSEGVVHKSEFQGEKELRVGDEVEVFVEKKEDEHGNLIISPRKAKILRSWEKIQGIFEAGEVIEGFVKRRTKGGFGDGYFWYRGFFTGFSD